MFFNFLTSFFTFFNFSLFRQFPLGFNYGETKLNTCWKDLKQPGIYICPLPERIKWTNLIGKALMFSVFFDPIVNKIESITLLGIPKIDTFLNFLIFHNPWQKVWNSRSSVWFCILITLFHDFQFDQKDLDCQSY